MTRQERVLTQPVEPLTRQLAYPMAMGILAIIMFSLVDTWFISLLGTTELAAISFTFPVTFTVSSFAMGMGIAMSAVVSRSLGGGDLKFARLFTTQGLLLAVIIVATIASIGFYFNQSVFELLGADQSTLPFILEYMDIWFMAIPLLVIPMVGNAAIRATGDTKTPSIVMIVAGVVNGILDPILIFGWGPVPELGIKGAALATAFSWGLTFIFAFYVLTYREKLISFSGFSLQTMASNWMQFIKIAIPATATQVLNPLATGILIAILAVFGSESVAAFGIGIRIEALVSIFSMSISSVIPIIIGQNIGAMNFERCRRALFYSVHLSLAIQFVIAIVLFLGARIIASIFTQDPEVLSLTVDFLRILPWTLGFIAVVMNFSQTLNTLHLPLASLFMNLSRLFLILLPASWLGAQLGETKGLFIGLALANTLFGISLYGFILWFTLKSKLIGRDNHPELKQFDNLKETVFQLRVNSVAAINIVLPKLHRLMSQASNARVEISGPAGQIKNIEKQLLKSGLNGEQLKFQAV